MSLQHCHRGYQYQDLSTAIAFARLVIRNVGSVTADRKDGAFDKFDDLTERTPGRRVSRQLKWTDNDDRPLRLNDLTGKQASSVNIGKLVKAHQGLQREPDTEVRLAVRWGHPTDEGLLDLLTDKPGAVPTFDGTSGRCFCLRADRIWPPDGAPAWPELESLDREDFLAFARDFTIETGLPESSNDLSAPGALELHLLDLLQNRVGIGHFPNQGRLVEDVAARLIYEAIEARGSGSTLSPEDIAEKMGLVRDFGHVVQDFPYRSAEYVQRERLRSALIDAVDNHTCVGLVGPPGSGKSWELTTIAEVLRDAGHLVARHYCYISPDDDHVQVRITSDVMYGNLIDELVAEEPELDNAKNARFAANADELQSVLLAACNRSSGHRRVVVVVDGLDHISRVAKEAREIRPSQMRIIEDLASLHWPDGSCLVVGSQPGSHLAPLLERPNATHIEMPALERPAIAKLAANLGLATAAGVVGDDLDQVHDLLIQKSEGNALYATMLIRGGAAAADQGTPPTDYLGQAPQIAGDLNHYYEYLYGRLSDAGQMIAGVLGVIDFAVSQEELRDIVGAVAALSLTPALRELAPLLVEVAGKGGIRIFHESFRRFVIGRAPDPSEHLRRLLQPVVDWLEAAGFYSSPRSFRFLLRSLARSGQLDRMFGLLAPDYVPNAVENCHSEEEIRRNLDFGCAVAATQQDFPKMIRLEHLIRAADTCFENLQDNEAYWEAFLAVRGPEEAAARLALDGRPRLERHEGLRVCSRVADAGGAPPWSTYLSLPLAPFAESYAPDRGLADQGRTLAAVLLGQAHVHGLKAAADWATDLLSEASPKPGAIVHAVATRWLEVDPASALAALEDPRIDGPTRSHMMLAAAEAHIAADGSPGFAQLASANSSDPDLLVRSAMLGAPLPTSWDSLNPEDADLTSPWNDGFAATLGSWLAQTRLLAFVDPERLSTLRTHISFRGWYGRWLIFSTQVSEAEATLPRDPATASQLVVGGFRELGRNVDRFEGKPRLVDLFSAHGAIMSTIRRGLACVQDSDWEAALDELLELVQTTTGDLKGEMSGPIAWDGCIELLLPYLSTPTRPATLGAIRTAVERAGKYGQMYAMQAYLEFMEVHALAETGLRDEAEVVWSAACAKLAGYGHHKDNTIFELIESLPSLADDKAYFLKAVERMWSLVTAATSHTSGRSTRYGPNALLKVLTTAYPSAGLAVVVEALQGEADPLSWVDEDAYKDGVRSCHGRVAPSLALLAETTIPFEMESGSGADQMVKPLVEAMEETPDDDPIAPYLATRLAARVEGDPARSSREGWADITNAAARFGVQPQTHPYGSEASKPGPDIPKAPSPSPPPAPPTPKAGSLLEFLGWIRRRIAADPRGLRADLVQAVGNRVAELSLAGRGDDAIRVLSFLHRTLPQYSGDNAATFEGLADLLARAGHPKPSAHCYVLAFTESRGGRGWHQIGDSSHEHLLDAAEAQDLRQAEAVFAEEVSRKITDGHPAGVTRSVIARIAGKDLTLAKQVWEEAFVAIAARLTTDTEHRPWLPTPESDSLPKWGDEEALIAAIIARCSHPEADRRGSSLLAFAHAVQLFPQSSGSALDHVLLRGPSPQASLELLDVLWEAETAPYEATKAARNALEAACAHHWFGIRALGQRLLQRASIQPPPSGAQPLPSGHRVSDAQVGNTAVFVGLELVQALDGLWPGFAHAVAARFAELQVAPSARARQRDRYQYAGDQNVEPRHWTPIVPFERELVTQAMHETISGYLTSSPPPENLVEFESQLLADVLPDIHLQLGLVASRVPRPELPPPSAAAEGFVDPKPIVGGLFDGWIRVGLYEREYEYDKYGTWGNPSAVHEHLAGLQVAGLGIELPPLVPSNGSTWRLDAWAQGAPVISSIGPQPLVAVHSGVDAPCMTYHALMLPPGLANRFGLRAGPWPAPLSWLDADGQPVVRLRTWEVGATRSKSRPGRLKGCDLLMHRKLYDRLNGAAAGPLRMLHSTGRKGPRGTSLD